MLVMRECLLAYSRVVLTVPSAKRLFYSFRGEVDNWGGDT